MPGRSVFSSIAVLFLLATACSVDPEDLAALASLDLFPAPDVIQELPAPETADLPPDPAEETTPAALPPPPVLMNVEPAAGPSGGLQAVVLSGTGLGEATAVLFGESPGLDVQALGDNTVWVNTPPRPPGMVDVTLRVADGRESTLPLAYRYEAEVAVSGVKPDFGPVEGGTLVTVIGGGFDASTRFVFGERLAIDVIVLDDHTAAMRTPPGIAGRVRVVAAGSDGTGELDQAFEYRGEPRLDLVLPGAGPVAGGT
jgi:hypothetical protein